MRTVVSVINLIPKNTLENSKATCFYTYKTYKRFIESFIFLIDNQKNFNFVIVLRWAEAAALRAECLTFVAVLII